MCELSVHRAAVRFCLLNATVRAIPATWGGVLQCGSVCPASPDRETNPDKNTFNNSGRVIIVTTGIPEAVDHAGAVAAIDYHLKTNVF
jgi:hypothetical protein